MTAESRKNNRLAAVVISNSSANRNSSSDRVPWHPALAPGIQYQETNDEIVLLDKENRRVHQLNQIGTAVLRYCDGTNTAADIVNHMLKEYEIGPEKVSADVADLLQRLKNLELLI